MMQVLFEILFKFKKLANRLRGAYYRSLINTLGGRCSSGLRVDSGFRFKYPPHSGIHIGKNVFLGSHVILDVMPSACLRIGNEVNLTKYIVIAAAEKIEIGNNVLVGEYTSIRDADHGIKKGILISKQPLVCESIKIGNDVWIGRGAAVLKGTTIGDGSVIGANAVVNRIAVGVNSIAVGVPAKVIRCRE